VKSQKSKAITDAINEAQVSSFLNCFFKNRFANDNVDDLSERCLPADTNVDWAEIRECVADTSVSNPITAELAAITGGVTSDIQTDGLVVRFNGDTVNEKAKTDLLGEICKAIPVGD